jgi:hypothetical protein
MMVRRQGNAGEMVAAITCEWVAAVMRDDAQVIAVTRNVLNRFGGPKN